MNPDHAIREYHYQNSMNKTPQLSASPHVGLLSGQGHIDQRKNCVKRVNCLYCIPLYRMLTLVDIDLKFKTIYI